MLSGTLELQVDGRTLRLNAGDNLPSPGKGRTAATTGEVPAVNAVGDHAAVVLSRAGCHRIGRGIRGRTGQGITTNGWVRPSAIVDAAAKSAQQHGPITETATAAREFDLLSPAIVVP